MGDPDLRARLVNEAGAMEDDPIISGFMHPSRTFPLGDPPDYEPPPSSSIAAIAARGGTLAVGGALRPPARRRRPAAAERARPQLFRRQPRRRTRDAGAPDDRFRPGRRRSPRGPDLRRQHDHVLLSYWARDRDHGRLAMEEAVRKLTSATADVFGLGDRGRLAEGMKADMNVIDFDQLRPRATHTSWPTCLEARSGSCSVRTGYVATVNSGELTFDDGEDTGARPGVLVRGAR